MKGHIMKGASPGLVLALAVAVGTLPAFAHGKDGSIRGVITLVSSTSLELQTSTGSVTVSLAESTHISRIVTGSLADLAKGQNVDLHVVPGTSTVDAVRIHLETKNSPQAHRPRTTSPRGKPGPTTHGRPDHNKPAKTPTAGQIVTVTDSTITIRLYNGQTVSYTLDSNVSITKIMSGKLSDLSIGEAVQVQLARRGNTAVAITILNT